MATWWWVARRKLFRDAVAHAMREAGIGHGAERDVCGGGQIAQDWQQKLRTYGAIGADGLHVERF